MLPILEIDPHHPHDSLVRYFFRLRKNVIAFLKAYLPAPLSLLVDWDSLRLELTSFINDVLRGIYSDVLVSVNIAGHPARIYLLIEHKSQQEKDTLIQILEQMTRVTKLISEDVRFKQIAPVLALILHHGARPWKGSLELNDHYGFSPELKEIFAPLTLNYKALLVDLAVIPMQDIQGGPVVESLLKALKAVSEDCEHEFLLQLKQLVSQEGNLEGQLATLLLYILAAGNKTSEDQILEIAKISGDANIVKDVMTGAERLMAKGRTEGRAEGRAEGRTEGLEHGTMLGRIISLQEVLGRETFSEADLQKMSLDQLRDVLADIRVEWNSRKS